MQGVDAFERKLTEAMERAKHELSKYDNASNSLDFSIRGELFRIAHEIAPDARIRELEAVKLLADPKPGEVAADITAGIGFLSSALSHWTQARVYAISPDEKQYEILAKISPTLVFPIKGSIDNLSSLSELPLSGLDLIVSLAQIHHVQNQKAMLLNVSKLLRPGGRFIGVDVGAGTPLSAHFDLFVDKFCITGHKAQWLEEERLRSLLEGVPLDLIEISIKPLSMIFQSEVEMYLFFKGLHALDLKEADIINELKKRLGFYKDGDAIHLNWPLLCFILKRR